MGRLKKKKRAVKLKKDLSEVSMSNDTGAVALDDKSGVVKASAGAMTKQPAHEKKYVPVSKSELKPKKVYFWDKVFQFIREVRVELKKVTWPSRKQTIGSTVVIILLVLIVSAYLGIVDYLLTELIGLALH